LALCTNLSQEAPACDKKHGGTVKVCKLWDFVKTENEYIPIFFKKSNQQRKKCKKDLLFLKKRAIIEDGEFFQFIKTNMPA